MPYFFITTHAEQCCCLWFASCSWTNFALCSLSQEQSLSLRRWSSQDGVNLFPPLTVDKLKALNSSLISGRPNPSKSGRVKTLQRCEIEAAFLPFLCVELHISKAQQAVKPGGPGYSWRLNCSLHISRASTRHLGPLQPTTPPCRTS